MSRHSGPRPLVQYPFLDLGDRLFRDVRARNAAAARDVWSARLAEKGAQPRQAAPDSSEDASPARETSSTTTTRIGGPSGCTIQSA